MGSRDETSGCQLCVATIAEDGSLNLQLRMPDALAEQHGKYLLIQNVRFAHGHEQVLAALQSNAEYTRYLREHDEKAARSTNLGQAISYRFKRDGRGWRVFVTTRMMDVTVVTDRRRGAIGVDMNADHLAVAETDASGNWLNAWRCRWSPMARALIRLRPSSVMRWPGWSSTPVMLVSPSLSRSWTFVRRSLSWKVKTGSTPGCFLRLPMERLRGTSSPVVIAREWRYIRSTRPSVR